MRIYSQRFFNFFIAILFILVILPHPALAQSPPINLQISPLPILLDTKPGTTTAADLRVRNAASTAVRLKATIKTFTTEGQDGHIVFHEPGPADEFVKWVHFSRSVFEAPAGQWQTIKMTVAVPAGAAFGYYWAVQFEPAAATTSKPGAASIRGAVAIFVLLNANAPGAKREVKVTSFSADRKTYEFLPVNFSVAVHGSGNVHLIPTGNIFIKRGGKQVGVLSLNPNGGYVLPDANRLFKVAWSDGFPVYKPVLGSDGQPLRNKDGSIKQHLSWDFGHANRLRFGHYTANLLLVYNNGARDIPISGTLSFWVIPWRLIGFLLIVALFVGVGLWSTFGRVKRTAKRLRSKS